MAFACYICGQSATAHHAQADVYFVSCASRCGSYEISGTAAALVQSGPADLKPISPRTFAKPQSAERRCGSTQAIGSPWPMDIGERPWRES